jgi:hypothetical protein
MIAQGRAQRRPGLLGYWGYRGVPCFALSGLMVCRAIDMREPLLPRAALAASPLRSALF